MIPVRKHTRNKTHFLGTGFGRHSQVEVALIGYSAEHRDESLLTVRNYAVLFIFLRRGDVQVPFGRWLSFVVFPRKDLQQVDHLDIKNGPHMTKSVGF